MIGLNVSDTITNRYQARLDDMRADAALDESQRPTRDLSALDYQHRPFDSVVQDGDTFTYPEDMAQRRGWPVGGRVRWIGPRFEVVA